MDTIAQAIFTFTIFIIFATFHEYAHGWMANRLGDSTAKRSGRLTLNPIAHIDIFWTIILPAMILISSGGRFAFGSAKPVPVNPYWLNKPKKDMIWVGLAGPSTNIAWSLIFIILMKSGLFSPASPVYLLFFICMYINIILLVFNMIPIPPLDGSRVVEGLLPDKYAEEYSKIGRYGFLILMGLMFFGILGRLFSFVIYLIMIIFSLSLPLRGF
ncbi:site-2 protease family protein [Candidatus Poribacteria bacterium]|nr:site-2 protease family protein [Candidatus Poribacteria bacterium]